MPQVIPTTPPTPAASLPPPVTVTPDPGSGNPAYFPAFTVVMPPPLIGNGNWVRATPTIPIPEGPEWRIPPFTAPTSPPSPGTNPPTMNPGELEADYLTRCEGILTAAGVDQTTAEETCQEAWDEQNNVGRAASAPAPKKRKRKS